MSLSNRMIIRFIILSQLFYMSFFTLDLLSQEDDSFSPDSVIRFTSPRPLINLEELNSAFKRSWGVEMNISGHGFGVGGYWERKINSKFSLFTHTLIANAKGSDEFETFIPGELPQVIGKVSRIYMMPLMFGAKSELFQDKISPNFKPFIAVGAGPTFILSNPYREDRDPFNPVVGFFSSFSESEFYTRFGAFLEVGSGISFSSNNYVNVHIRYYYIPFGGDGLESMFDLPIKDFGGLFLGISIAILY